MSTVALSAAAGEILLALGNHPSLDTFVDALLRSRPDLNLLVVRDADHARPQRWPEWPQVREHSVQIHDSAQLIDMIDSHAARMGCVMSWPCRLPDALIERFSGKLFNLHYGDLPRYRGAGGGSWQVLNGETSVKAHIQLMHSELDRGPLLLSETEPLGSHPFPCDVKAAAARAADRSVLRLAGAIAAGRTMPLTAQDESAALYFPRLSTLHNGWINFAWPAEAIERFIRAFSDPYPGAAFRCGNKIYRVRRSRLRHGSVLLHPFCAGLIANRTAESVDIAAYDGVLHFDEIVDESGQRACPSDFPVGGRCWSSAEDLGFALQYRPRLAAPPRCSGGTAA